MSLSILEAAVIEHHKFWLTSDFAFEKRAANFDAGLARDIANTYGVVRGFKGKRPTNPEDDRSASRIAMEIGSLNLDPKVSLKDKYEVLIDVLDRLRRGDATSPDPAVRYNLVSGLTKLFWFTQLRNWTMFDDFAARAIDAKGSAIVQGREFYGKLEGAEFASVAKALNSSIQRSDAALQGLHGERVIDKFLWLTGAPASVRSQAMASASLYLEALGTGLGDKLRHLAAALDEKHAADINNMLAKAKSLKVHQQHGQDPARKRRVHPHA